jgi:hypothetical protein
MRRSLAVSTITSDFLRPETMNPSGSSRLAKESTRKEMGQRAHPRECFVGVIRGTRCRSCERMIVRLFACSSCDLLEPELQRRYSMACFGRAAHNHTFALSDGPDSRDLGTQRCLSKTNVDTRRNIQTQNMCRLLDTRQLNIGHIAWFFGNY